MSMTGVILWLWRKCERMAKPGIVIAGCFGALTARTDIVIGIEKPWCGDWRGRFRGERVLRQKSLTPVQSRVWPHRKGRTFPARSLTKSASCKHAKQQPTPKHPCIRRTRDSHNVANSPRHAYPQNRLSLLRTARYQPIRLIPLPGPRLPSIRGKATFSGEAVG
jgi:hypothetical protein